MPRCDLWPQGFLFPFSSAWQGRVESHISFHLESHQLFSTQYEGAHVGFPRLWRHQVFLLQWEKLASSGHYGAEGGLKNKDFTSRRTRACCSPFYHTGEEQWRSNLHQRGCVSTCVHLFVMQKLLNGRNSRHHYLSVQISIKRRICS